MEIIIKEDEYFDKIAPLNEILDSISVLINKIQKNYNELNKYSRNYFVFPIKDFQNLSEFIRNLKNKSNVDEEEYESLIQLLKDFSTKIKESSYENKIMSNIRDNNYELKELNNKIYSMHFNNFINKKLSTSKNLNVFDQDNNTTKDYETYFPYINEKPQINNNENNYKISLTCSNEQCKGKVKYFCNKHCYKYFCESCKKESDEEFYVHQFIDISEDEEKEIQKINFINCFLSLLKTYVEKSDYIFKEGDKIKKSNYPILKNFDEFNSQIEFLNGIYNFQNKNDNNNKRHICESIKNSIVKAFELDIPILNIIDDEFNDSYGDENLIIKEKIDLDSENLSNMNKLNKIKLIIKNNYKKFFAHNSPRYDYLADYKNIINELIDKEIQITKEKLNSKYNFIIPNLNSTFTKNMPYYDWFGIGLNYENIWKIEENEDNYNIPKAIAFYAFNNKMTSDEIKSKLSNIIMNKSLLKDHNMCINVYNSINAVEKNTGIIDFGNKKYYIALMARISPSKKRQLDNDKWILRPKEIEFISIMLKEIKI